MTEAEQKIVKEYLSSLRAVRSVVVTEPDDIPWAELCGHSPPVAFPDSEGMPAEFRTLTAAYFWWTSPERYVEELLKRHLVDEWDGDRLFDQ